MTYSPVIYDWRQTLAPLDQVFYAGGTAIEGGQTLGGTSWSNPEPGGRGVVQMNFATFVTPEQNLDASWTISRFMNGAVMRLPLWQTVQIVPNEALDIPDTGQTWANGLPWANDTLWKSRPYAPVSEAAARGVIQFKADMTVTGPVLSIGHVIGFFLDGYDFTHVVLDIEYDDGEATVTVSPPLRRALTTDDLMLFRPTMLVTCTNAPEVMGTFARGRHMTFNGARFVESLV